MSYGYHKIIAVSPRLSLGNVQRNVDEHVRVLKEVSSKEPSVVLFPELSLTGYTCEDLFHTQSLLNSVNKGIIDLAERTKDLNMLIVIGLPYQHRGKLYNASATIYKGQIKTLHSKIFLPNYKEFYENRWFSEGEIEPDTVMIGSHQVLFSNKQILKLGKLVIGIEICEDLFAVNNPSSNLALAGANLILNLSASNELVGKGQYRRDLLKITSAKLNCGYLYASSGPFESTKDLAFSGYLGYCEDGSILSEDSNMSFDTKILETEIDVEKIGFERRKNTTFGKNRSENYTITTIDDNCPETVDIKRKVAQNPFVPQGDKELEDRIQEILEIQSVGLARRLLSISPDTKMVLGLSGGLDSTLALLVAIEACKKLNISTDKIHTISMPGFGTSERTKNQARDLAKSFNTTFREIDITKVVSQHLTDIDHSKIDTVYENAQARERTQILFDYANKVGAFVINTSCLSEAFLGWSTFGADQLGNYGVNISVPKSLVRFMIQHYPATNIQREVLKRVYETPVSPELLPLDSKKQISQKTEDLLGPYELIDFYIYYYLRNGFSNKKILFLANSAYKDKYESEYIEEVFKNSYKRFRVNQFKRTTIPPGVKIGVSISSRGDLRIPDEYEGEDNDG